MGFKRGSTLPESDRPKYDCAHAPHCTEPAVTRQKVSTGMANFCMTHYLDWIAKSRQKRWEAAGRPTMEQSIGKYRSLLASLEIHPERIPGEDDNLEAA